MRRLFALTLLIGFAISSTPAAYADSSAGGLKAHKFGPHTIFGFIASLSGTTLVVQKRNGKQIITNISSAVLTTQLGVLYIGRAVALHGDYGPGHIYLVNSITSANQMRYGLDPPDE